MVALISGRGSNLQALIDATTGAGKGGAHPAGPHPAGPHPAEIVGVISNVPGVYGLERASAAGIPARVVPSRGRDRSAFEAALLAEIADLGGADWICLAGFMRVLTGAFLGAFPGRVLNIHPALLPAFPGLHGPRQALAAGVAQAGCTVHLVDAGVDTGAILAQASVPVLDDDTEDTLAARILEMEHRIYPMVLRQAAEGRISVAGGRATVRLLPGESRWIRGASPPGAR